MSENVFNRGAVFSLRENISGPASIFDLGNKTPIKAKFGHSDNWTEDLVLMEPGKRERLSHTKLFF